jgi:hypothetical protein
LGRPAGPPIHDVFFWDRRAGRGLNCRELFYMSLFRVETALFTAGPAAIKAVIGRPTNHRLRTTLAARIRATREFQHGR